MDDQKLLDEAVKELGSAKMKILEAVKGAGSPSVLHTAQVTIDHLDTTYLWMSQLAHFLHMTGEAGVEQAVSEAAERGRIIQGDFTPKG